MAGAQTGGWPVCAYCGVRIRFADTMVKRGTDVYCCLNCAVEDRGIEAAPSSEAGAVSPPSASAGPAEG